MKKIMFNDKYGLTEAVLGGSKTMTRRVATYEEVADPHIRWPAEDRGRVVLCDGNRIVKRSEYKMGEVVAIAQSCIEVYRELNEKFRHRIITDKEMSLLKHYDRHICNGEDAPPFAGWTNKMFVRASLMPHHIKITDIHAERMQDITPEDCIKEGVLRKWYTPGVVVAKTKEDACTTPRASFAALIDRTCGKGTWEKNPWVFVYTFELVD